MDSLMTSTHSAVSDETMLSFEQAIRARRSIRAFRPDVVPSRILQEVLLDAQHAPSNCNTQPWNVHIVSGTKRNALSVALHEAYRGHRLSTDFSWDETAFSGRYDERRREQGKVYYENLGVVRDDGEARADAAAVNFSFFNAPHAALLFMPIVGDGVRVAGDIGMYAENFLLSLAARGLGGVPQTVLGLYADVVRKVLDIPFEQKLLFGISFGYPDEDARANRSRMGRDPVAASVTFHE
jgi:nitroreductase